METIRFQLNRRPIEIQVDGDRTLLWVLRTDLALTGTKYACGEALCGACTVLIDGAAVPSCATPVREVEGKEVLTIEGLGRNGNPHPVQEAFIRHDALQCGFCTPGMILTAYHLLAVNPHPSREEIIRRMEGNLCRCGSYDRIIEAIQSASRAMRGGNE